MIDLGQVSGWLAVLSGPGGILAVFIFIAFAGARGWWCWGRDAAGRGESGGVTPAVEQEGVGDGPTCDL